MSDRNQLIARIIQEATKANLFTPSEFEQVQQMLQAMSLDELINDYAPRWLADLYKWEPVAMESWLFDREYMNLGNNIYPMLADDLIALIDGKYTEAVIDGSIGWGKSYFTALALTRKLYELSCYRDPQLALGLAPGSQIVLANIATKERVAREVVFGYIQNFVKASPYFNQHFPMDKDLVAELKFPNGIRIAPAASTQGSVIGQNIFAAVIDEANFLFRGDSIKATGTSEEYDLAKVLHNAVSRRIKSRFGNYQGLLIAASSTMYPDDFTTQRMADAARTGERIFYRHYSQWEPKPQFKGFDTDPKQYFNLSIGGDAVRPRILRDVGAADYDEHLDDRAKLEAAKIKIVKVPNDFLLEFRRDIDMAVRDIAGYATQSRYPFFRNTEIIQAAMDRAARRGITHPWSHEVTTLFDEAAWLKENLDDTKRGRHHFAHIDLGLTGDAAGIAVVRLDGIEEVVVETPSYSAFTDEFTVDKVRTFVPKMTTVLMLRVVGSSDREVPLAKVRQVLLDMVNWGYNLAYVSYDRFSSAESIQAFKHLGLAAGYVSVDRTLEPYNSLKEAFDDERLDMYRYEPIVKELGALELDLKRKKVDHPPRGCFVGSTTVRLADGTIKSFDELSGDAFVDVLGYDGAGFAAQPGVNVRQTGETRELVDIHLSNGAVVRSTRDHRYLTVSGRYTAAEDLAPGVALRSYPTANNVTPIRVRNVVLIALAEPVPVYDLTNPVTRNYLLGAGVVVHNSKDNADALAGAVFNCVTFVRDNGGILIPGEVADAEFGAPILTYGDEVYDPDLMDHSWLRG